MITSLSELHFRYRRFILLQTKEMVSVSHSSSISIWKRWRWMRLDLIFMIRDINTFFNFLILTNISVVLHNLLPSIIYIYIYIYIYVCICMYMYVCIYISSDLDPFTKFSCSSRRTEFKDVFPWNISQMITKTVPIDTRLVINCVMERDISFYVWRKVSGNWDNNMIRISRRRETTVEQILGLEEGKKSKRAGLWAS